jgi:hypothetical protein
MKNMQILYKILFITLLAQSGFSQSIEYKSIWFTNAYPNPGGGTTYDNVGYQDIEIKSGDRFTLEGWGHHAGRVVFSAARLPEPTNGEQVYRQMNDSINWYNAININSGGSVAGPAFVRAFQRTDINTPGYSPIWTYATVLQYKLQRAGFLEETNVSANIIPTASVVVPVSATGDVDVLLEQSTDMITWTQCLPGTYNASTQKRFFRVRAVEK